MDFSLSTEEIEEITETLLDEDKDFVWSEPCMLRIIEKPSSYVAIYWAVLGLRDCGTLACIPALKALAVHPKQDVKNSAILTIAQVAQSDETEYYSQLLLDPKYRGDKDYALWAIGVFGDARATAAVRTYMSKNKKKIAANNHDPRAQQEIIAFYYRTAGHAATDRMLSAELADIRSALQSSFPTLPPTVKNEFIKRVPKLANMF